MIKKIFLNLMFISLLVVWNSVGSVLYAQDVTLYPDIPRIDVHCHIGSDTQAIQNFLKLRDQIKAEHDVDFAMWINLGKGDEEINTISDITTDSKGRIVVCISDYSSHDGLKYPPEDLQSWLDKGFVGYKIWAGPYYRRLKEGQEGYRYIDNPALDPTFKKMEEIGMVGASIHIADPNCPWPERGNWLADPIEYWKEITAWRHVLERHPKLIAVMAHSDWLICQDAQIDYLRNMLATFPNLYVDLAATFQYYPFVKRGNLRAFMLEWADRIVYGTDIGTWEGDEATTREVQNYFRTFQILERDQLVKGGFFGNREIEGLSLPRDVLEKIYYRNAMKIYPHVKGAMVKLGYKVN